MSNQLIPMEQLKVLVAVAESHSMKEAANQLHKTQPALSQAIKGLESMLGIELFDRSDYRLRLPTDFSEEPLLYFGKKHLREKYP